MTALLALLLLSETAAAKVIPGPLCPNSFTVNGDRIHYCRQQHIQKPNDVVERAIIVIHGSDRDAKDAFDRFKAARADEGYGPEVSIIAPQFLRKEDVDEFDVEERYEYWNYHDWAVGADALNRDHTSSFQWVDWMIEQILQNWSALEHITVVGISAGGQFTQRFAAFSRMHDVALLRGVKMNFVVGAPSTYLWLSEDRPGPNCDTCNDYPYGVDHRGGYSYLASISDDEIIVNLLGRRIWYVVGAKDLAGWTNDESLAQGAHRVARAQNYVVEQFDVCYGLFGDMCSWQPPLRVVPGLGHKWAIFDDPESREMIFRGI